MPTTGYYEFKLAVKAIDGFIEHGRELQDLKPGEWAWVKMEGLGDDRYLLLYLMCPDCKSPATLWRRFKEQVVGHNIDAQGNVSPSILHNWIENGIEKCGFHTQPTKLLGFMDKR